MTSERSGPATISVIGRLLATRHIVLAAAVVLAGLALIVDTLRVAARMRAVDLDAVALQPGEEVVAVAGVRGVRLPALLTEVPAGATTPMVLAKAGVEREVQAPTRPLPEIHTIA